MYFVHDFETGGLCENASILTFYGAVLDEKFSIIDEIEFSIKPENGIYVVEARALEINKINILEHNRIARPVSECAQILKDFLLKHTNFRNKKLCFCGHNVYFDNELLKKHLLLEPSEFYFHRHNLDTASTALVLKSLGKLPKNFNISLVNLAELYGIDATNAHQSKADVFLTIAVLKKMMAELKT
jgi:DNA polymerase III alpha subunit (gram-positive type)